MEDVQECEPESGDAVGGVDASPFPTAGFARRARRVADCSQREFAELLAVSQGRIARAESGGELPVALLARILAAAGLRLAVIDCATGAEVAPMRADAHRDHAGRHYPAHLDPGSVTGPYRWLSQFKTDRAMPMLTYQLRPWRDPQNRSDPSASDHPPAPPPTADGPGPVGLRPPAVRLRPGPG